MATPGAAIVDLLVAQGYAHATAGSNLFSSPEMPSGAGVAVDATFIRSTGGPAPDRYMNSANNAIWYPEVQVTVRTAEATRNTAVVNARAAADIIHANAATGYIMGQLIQSEPVYLGQNDESQHRYVFNARLWLVQ